MRDLESQRIIRGVRFWSCRRKGGAAADAVGDLAAAGARGDAGKRCLLHAACEAVRRTGAARGAAGTPGLRMAAGRRRQSRTARVRARDLHPGPLTALPARMRPRDARAEGDDSDGYHIDLCTWDGGWVACEGWR